MNKELFKYLMHFTNSGHAAKPYLMDSVYYLNDDPLRPRLYPFVLYALLINDVGMDGVKPILTTKDSHLDEDTVLVEIQSEYEQLLNDPYVIDLLLKHKLGVSI